MRTVKIFLTLCFIWTLLLSSSIGGIFISWEDEQRFPAVDLNDKQAVVAAVAELWKKTLDYRITGQVLVKKDGKPLFSGASGGSTLQTPTLIGSISKQFTGRKTLQLVKSKKIGVDDTICMYLSDYCAGDLQNITIDHLLRHTSGLPPAANGGLFQGIVIDHLFTKPLELRLKPIEMEPLEFKPGERFEYSNLGYDLLARIIEVVEQKPIAGVMNDFFSNHSLENTVVKEPTPIEGLYTKINLRLFGGPLFAKLWIPAQIAAYENFPGGSDGK